MSRKPSAIGAAISFASMPDSTTTLDLLLREVRRHPLWLLLWTLGFGLLGWLTAAFLEPSYSAKGVIAIAQGATRYDYWEEPTKLAEEPDIEREVHFLRSKQLLETIYPQFQVTVDDLNRYWPHLGRLGLTVSVPGEQPRLRLEPDGAQDMPPFRWQLSFPSEERVHLQDEHGGLSGDYALEGKRLSVGGLEFNLVHEGKLTGGEFAVVHQRRADWVRMVQHELTASPSARNAHVVVLEYRDTDPYRAAQLVDALMEAYQAHYLSRFAADAIGQVPKLVSQLASSAAALKAAEDARSAFEADTLSLEPALRIGGLYGSLAQLETQRAELAAEEEVFHALVQMLDADPAPADFDLAAAVRASEETDAFFSALLSELATAGRGSTPALQLQSRLEEAVRGRAAALDQELAAFDRALAAQREEIGRFPALAAKQRQMALETHLAEEHHAFLSKRLQEARLAEQTRVDSVALIDRASVPDRREGPFLGAYLAIGLLAGFLFGAVILIYRQPKP